MWWRHVRSCCCLCRRDGVTAESRSGLYSCQQDIIKLTAIIMLDTRHIYYIRWLIESVSQDQQHFDLSLGKPNEERSPLNSILFKISSFAMVTNLTHLTYSMFMWEDLWTTMTRYSHLWKQYLSLYAACHPHVNVKNMNYSSFKYRLQGLSHKKCQCKLKYWKFWFI